MADKKYEAILFDWDGTLARSIPVWEHAFTSVFETLHMPININEATEKLWLDSQILIELGIDHEGFFDLVYEQLSRSYYQTPLYDEVERTLLQLQKSGIKMALVTSTRRKLVILALEYHHLLAYFTCVVASEDVINHKPSPEPYELALAHLSSPKENTIIVGDSKFDLLGSVNVGIDCALFFPKENKTYYNEAELKALNPKYVWESHSQVLHVIKT